jgi:hypothetical protein
MADGGRGPDMEFPDLDCFGGFFGWLVWSGEVR